VRIGGNTYHQFHNFDFNAPHDIIFLGASKAMKAYNPEIFNQSGLSTYNLASHVQDPENSYEIVKHYLNASNCKHIFYEITDGLYSQPLVPSTQSDIDLITNTPGNGVALDILYRNFDPKLVNIYSIRQLQLNPIAFQAEPAYKGLGFVGRLHALSLLNRKELQTGKQRPTDKVVWDKQSISELKALIELIKSKNIQLTGIYGPVSSYYSDKRTAQYVDYMRGIFNSYGCEFWDLSRLPGIEDKTHYSDLSHLNKAGADIFSDTVVSRIKRSESMKSLFSKSN